MTDQEYIAQLKREKKVLQDQLDQVRSQKEKKKKVGFWLLRKSSVPLLGTRLKKSISTAIHEYKESKTVSVDTVSDVSSNIIWRVTRIGIFAFFMTIIPSLILIYQTLLVVNQNNLVAKQNSLIEADRRSSLVFVMSDVLGDLNEELKYKGSGEHNISPTLGARIVSLCMAMKPYKYIENGKLIEKMISPERGQLLYSLLQSSLGKSALRDILNAADFRYTNMEKVFLGRGAYLKYARLEYSNFREAEMPAANLEGSILRAADMTEANLSDGVLVEADLTQVNLRKAELRSANFTNAKLFKTDLTGADLTEANLWGAKLHGAIFKDIILDNVIVHRKDWISYVSDSLKLKGAGDIEDRYRIKKQGKQQFVLVAK